MKKNLEFYQHFTDADQHPKFKMLRVKYGWEGEGKFWALNNRIGLAKDGWLNLSKKFNKGSIATDLDFNLEEFDEFISYLENDCELIFWDEKKECISNDTIQENLKKVMGERAASRERKKRKKKLSKSASSPEPEKSSPEPSESSPEQNKKPNQTKPNQIKPNQIYQQCAEVYTEISNAIDEVDGLFKNNLKIFNARKWAVDQYRNRGHPKAILKTFRDMLDAKFVIENPNGLANHIMKRENGNYHEADAIQMHEYLKTLPQTELSELTQGLFKEL